MKLTGLKRPAFYVHFRDKYDLALRVVQDIGQELFTLANHWLKEIIFRKILFRHYKE